MKLQLSLAIADNPRTRAIFDGRVQPDGIDFIPTALHASELFWRQLKFGDFDVSEMSMSSLMMAPSQRRRQSGGRLCTRLWLTCHASLFAFRVPTVRSRILCQYGPNTIPASGCCAVRFGEL